MRFTKKEWIVLALLILLAIVFRYFTISDNNVLFYYDQARDSYLATPIVSGDFKIQGPSASGSNDILYHGVLYYYVIAPFYALFHGNPFPVSLILGIINALTIIPLYFLSKLLTNSKRAAVLGCLLFALSFEASQLGTWLSNPNLAFGAIVLLYLGIWQTFFEGRKKWLVLVALATGLANQAILSTIYLFFVLAFVVWYRIKQEKSYKIFTVRQVVVSIVIYIATISTMLLTQILLHKNSLSQLSSMFTTTGGLENPYNSLQKVVELYAQNLAWPFIPFFLTVSFILALVFLVGGIKSLPTPQKRIFIYTWLLGPLSLLLFIQPNAYHTLIGLTALLYLVTGLVLFKISKSKYGMIVVASFFLIYISGNIYGVKRAHDGSFHIAAIQRGGLLQNQLDAIDFTYEESDNGPFTISTLAVPYGFNTTWQYLYNWYGKQKYGYVPTFYGPSQVGIFAGEYLQEAKEPLDKHFALYEPTRGLPRELIKDFSDHQATISAGPLSRQGFGTLTVELRQSRKSSQ